MTVVYKAAYYWYIVVEHLEGYRSSSIYIYTHTYTYTHSTLILAAGPIVSLGLLVYERSLHKMTVILV